MLPYTNQVIGIIFVLNDKGIFFIVLVKFPSSTLDYFVFLRLKKFCACHTLLSHLAYIQR